MILIIVIFNLQSVNSCEIKWSAYRSLQGLNITSRANLIESKDKSIYIAAYFFDNDKNSSVIAKLDSNGQFLKQYVITSNQYLQNIMPDYIYENSENKIALIGRYGVIFGIIYKSVFDTGFNTQTIYLDTITLENCTKPCYGILPGTKDEYYSVITSKWGEYGYRAGFKIYDEELKYIETKYIDSASYPEYSDVVLARKAKTDDNGYIAMGYFERKEDYSKEWYLYKVNEDFEVVYKSPVAAGDKTFSFSYINEEEDGNILVAGAYDREARLLWEPMDTVRAFFRKYSPDGTLLWEKLYGKTAQAGIADIIKTKDGGYLAVGNYRKYTSREEYDIYKYLFKTDSDGNLEFEASLDTVMNTALGQVIETLDGDYLIFGGGNYKYYIAKIDGESVLSVKDYVQSEENIALTPNPATDFLDVKISSETDMINNYRYEVYSILGEKLLSGEINNSKIFSIGLAGMNSGVYFLKITNDKVNISKKFIVN